MPGKTRKKASNHWKFFGARVGLALLEGGALSPPGLRKTALTTQRPPNGKR